MLAFVYSNVVTSMTTLVTPDVASKAIVRNTCKKKGGGIVGSHNIVVCNVHMSTAVEIHH